MWEKLLSITENILLSYLNDERRMFFLDENNLINIKEEFAGVTWMDVKIDGQAVTPRDGAPVEINFLWYEAHKTYQEMIEKYQTLSKKTYKAKYDVNSYTEKLAKSLEKFWHNNSLCDRITNNQAIDEFRPNAVIAAGLKYAPLSQEQLSLIYERASNELLTEYGLRTLTPNHHKFKRTYYGTIIDRDKAYHQGTVWAWLLWPYTSLYLRLFKGRLTNEQLIEGLESIIKQFRHEYKHGYIASIASIWDGGKPHFPKGAPAEAWSVAAVYDIEKVIEKLKENKD
jgi:predicted glycogen debranching enzyme